MNTTNGQAQRLTDLERRMGEVERDARNVIALREQVRALRDDLRGLQTDVAEIRKGQGRVFVASLIATAVSLAILVSVLSTVGAGP